MESESTHHQIDQARQVLQALQFDADRTNDRSALVLLALLRLTPEAPWSEATNPVLRTFEIRAWIREHYGRDYAPNTRETIRRFTLHQFADALLVIQNPDRPDRPINSPKWCYQITTRALDVLRSVGKPDFEQRVAEYLRDIPGLRAQHAAAREMNRIPVTLPNGNGITLSPGGQNVLLKQMIEDFCTLFTPGGFVLYVGDADEKYAVFEADAFRRLHIVIEQQGKMPDLVVYLPDKNWLVLLEAVSSHGPVDATRHRELASLFSSSSAYLVYVSCFPSRQDLRKYLPRVAWETDVWCADHPTHLIHFNGERFLGPYTSEESNRPE